MKPFLLFQRQFGPDGVRPPSCGGPASGFVCCRVSAGHNGQTVFISANGNSGGQSNRGINSNNGFQTSPSNINQVGAFGNRQTTNNGNVGSGFNSRFGQCGRRNARGITGRVAAGKFNPSEGDTEFGEKKILRLRYCSIDFFHCENG